MDHHVAYSLGAAFAQLQQKDKALYWLAQAVDTGFPCYPLFAGDSLLKPLHSERISENVAESQKIYDFSPFSIFIVAGKRWRHPKG